MHSHERLAGDQRAVLQLVLGQGRSYTEIAGMLSIAPDEVRARARAALDALGPPTTLPDAERGRIADYLLGQLPASDADAVRASLAGSPGQRAWARVVSSELGPIAAQPLPGIPDGQTAPPEPDRSGAPAESAAEPERGAEPPSSRTGGIVLLSVLAAAIIAAVVIFVIKPGSSSHNHPDPSPVASVSHAGSSSSTSSSSTTSASQSATIVGQINLAPPTGSGKVTGTAFVLEQGTLKGLGIEATHVPPTTTKPPTAYAVWLYNSPTDADRLGYVSKAVTKNGKLGASAELPANASHYKYLIITLETGSKASSTPGEVVLEGKLSQVAKAKL